MKKQLERHSIYLDPTNWEIINNYSQGLEVSNAEIIREAIDYYLKCKGLK